MKIKQRLLCAATAVITIFSTTLGSISVSAAPDDTFKIGNKTVKVGDYFQMGTYYDEPILWRCIALDDKGPLMLSDKILCIKAFDASGTNTSGSHGRGAEEYSVTGYYRHKYGSNYWGDSNIRDWLNSDASAGNVVWSCGNPPDKDHVLYGYNAYDQEAGFLNGFTPGERAVIKTVTQKQLLDGNEYSTLRNEDHIAYSDDIDDVMQNYDTAYSETTTDKVFLLDIKQIYDLYTDFGNYRKAFCTSKAVENSDFQASDISTSNYGSYWLRTPYDNNSSNKVRRIDLRGDVGFESAISFYGVGVRPAFYLDTRTAAVSGGSGSDASPYILGSSSNILYGDVNFDNKVNEADAATVLNFICTGEAFFPEDEEKNKDAINAANISGADIDILDVIWILNHKTA